MERLDLFEIGYIFERYPRFGKRFRQILLRE